MTGRKDWVWFIVRNLIVLFAVGLVLVGILWLTVGHEGAINFLRNMGIVTAIGAVLMVIYLAVRSLSGRRR